MPRICSANASRTLACRLRRSARPARKRCARRWSIPGSSTDRMAGASTGPVAQNRRARHDYFIDEVIEAGIVLEGSEVKALRKGSVSLNESYAGPKDGGLYLINCHIPEYKDRKSTRLNSSQ